MARESFTVAPQQQDHRGDGGGDNGWQDFSLVFSELSPQALDFVHGAYNFAYEAHKNSPPRKTGDPFITHPMAVAQIVYEEMGVRDPEMLAAALMHDVLEDTAAVLDTRDFRNALSRTLSRLVIVDKFNEKTARIIMGVSKAKVEKQEVPDKAARDKRFQEDLPQ